MCDKYVFFARGIAATYIDQTGQWELTDSDLIGQSVMYYRYDYTYSCMHYIFYLIPLVFFESKGSALTLTLFLRSSRIIMLCHCSSTMTKYHFLVIFYGI